MYKYLLVLFLAFLYGGLESKILDQVWWWKSWLMVPYWALLAVTCVSISFVLEKRFDRALLSGAFSAFVVLDLGYWVFKAFPYYPFPVYNWWKEWWPWNVIPYGYVVGEPFPLVYFPTYYFLLTIAAIIVGLLIERVGIFKLPMFRNRGTNKVPKSNG